MRFQTSVKASSVHMKFRFGCISKRPHILMDMCRHFISGSVYIICYYPKWNFISVKMTDMKPIPALSFKRTCALNATFNESALIHFALGNMWTYSYRQWQVHFDFCQILLQNPCFFLMQSWKFPLNQILFNFSQFH